MPRSSAGRNEEVLQYIRENPGSSASEVASALSDVNTHQAQRSLSQLATTGQVVAEGQEGDRRNHYKAT